MPDAVEATQNEGGAARLRRYWLTGRGSLAIRWNSPGDFTRCVREMHKHAPSMRDPEGYCAELHHEATGVYPGDRRNVGRVKASDDGGAMPNPEPSREDLIRSAFNSSQPESRWIVEIDEAEVIVIDDADRSLHRIPIEVGDTVTFGTATPVRMAYVAVDSELVAASRVVFASRAESRPAQFDQQLVDEHRSHVAAAEATVLDFPTQPLDPSPPAEPAVPAGPPPDEGSSPASTPDETPGAEPDKHNQSEPTKEDPVSLSEEIRSRLGLPEDADEAAVLTALDGLKQQADKPTEPTPDQVAASAAKDAENEELRKEVTVLASQMQQVTTELAAAKAKEAAVVKASVLGDAQRQGKFAPADEARWSEDYDQAPAVVTRVLASIAPGTAVPVAAAGYTGTGDEATDPTLLVDGEIDAWAKQLGIDVGELTR